MNASRLETTHSISPPDYIDSIASMTTNRVGEAMFHFVYHVDREGVTDSVVRYQVPRDMFTLVADEQEPWKMNVRTFKNVRPHLRPIILDTYKVVETKRILPDEKVLEDKELAVEMQNLHQSCQRGQEVLYVDDMNSIMQTSNTVYRVPGYICSMFHANDHDVSVLILYFSGKKVLFQRVGNNTYPVKIYAHEIENEKQEN